MKSIDICFDPAGPPSLASARLRAWGIAEGLRSLGLKARTGGDCGRTIHVFQKRVNDERLAAARKTGAVTVFDLDDNHLVPERGQRHATLAFMNLCDVVTVGSRTLLATVSPLHPRVLLVENPVDILPDAPVRPPRSWSEALCWFGSPENRASLDALNLAEPVATITRGGHIPWTLETIDEVLVQFDLALLPFLPGAWNDAKNANRLLKSLALGLPALAADTAEHRRVIHEFSLPENLLIDGAGPAWDRRIKEIGEEYDHVAAAVRAAAPRVRSRYSAERIAEDWLESVVTAATGAPRPVSHPPQCRRLDVLVIADLEPDRVDATINSLGDPAAFNSVTILATTPVAPRHGCRSRTAPDLFGLYPLAAAAMAEGTGDATLVLRAGVTLRPGAFAAIAARRPDQVLALPVQYDAPPVTLADPPPGDLAALLTHPWLPVAAVFPRIAGAPAGPAPQFGHLGLWEHAIRLVSCHGAVMAVATDPLALCPQRLTARTPTQVYAALARDGSMSFRQDLPSPDPEQDRLDITLASAVIAAHPGIFGRYASTIIPALWVDGRRHGRAVRNGSRRTSPVELPR